MNLEENNHRIFWTYKRTKTNHVIEIEIYKFIEFLEQNNFGYYEIGQESRLVHQKNNILKAVKESYISWFAKEYLKRLPEQLEYGIEREELIRVFHSKLYSLVHKNQLNTLKKIHPKYKKDTSEQAFKYFRNCFVEVTKDKIVCHDYKDLDGTIWDSQIIDRDFTSVSKEECVESDFCKFIFNCMGKDTKRYASMLTIIGYLVHTYKDSANAKAIVFCDQGISDTPNGGSGKSLTGRALSMLVKTAIEDGKTFKATAAFPFQQIEFDTKQIWIDDAAKDFDFESLFNPITNGITFEKKYQGKVHIPFEDSPKFLITTNYMIKGIGKSFERRMIEIEFSEYYNENNTPENEFGYRLFDDWKDTKQWQLFDSFILFCIQYYLENGIIEPPKINATHRKLIQETAEDFVEFAGSIPKNVMLDKANTFSNFIGQFPDFRNLRQGTFTRWLAIYAKYNDIIFVAKRSDNDRSFSFIPKPKAAEN